MKILRGYCRLLHLPEVHVVLALVVQIFVPTPILPLTPLTVERYLRNAGISHPPEQVCLRY